MSFTKPANQNHHQINHVYSNTGFHKLVKYFKVDILVFEFWDNFSMSDFMDHIVMTHLIIWLMQY